MKVLCCNFLFLCLILRSAFCKEASNKWLRLNSTLTIRGTFRSVPGQLSSAQCVSKCSETKGCISVAIQRDNLQCELAEQDPLDSNLAPNQRPGWTVYYRDIRNCKDVMKTGDTTTGYKTIFPDGIHPISALCIMDVEGGGWTVIQKREFNTNFYRDFQSYKNGFGDKTNFWIGLEQIYRLTLQGNFEVRIDMRRKTDGSRAAAKYQTFAVSSEADQYRLTIGGYGYDPALVNPGDSMIQIHNGMKFTTFDRDNDNALNKNCAQECQGAYWYYDCQHSNLNGIYGDVPFGQGINWFTWTGFTSFLDYTRMMIRPK